MSNHPLKHSEIKNLKAKIARKKKVIEQIPLLPPPMLIVSEGTKTEPNYINGIVSKINRRYADYTSRDAIIKVIGTGRNTRGLLEYSKKYVENNYPEARVVWLMFDKDDFPYDDFDNTINSASSTKGDTIYKTAWSNECIELWFILHFDFLQSANDRTYYQDRLSHLLGIKYEKSCSNIYDLLEDKTSIAIRNAKSLIDNTLPPSRNKPATKVYELIEELQDYLK